jgi:hypothetical protein
MQQSEIEKLVIQIKAIYAQKRYTFFERGDFNLNIIGIREDDIFDNTYSDTLIVLYKKAGVWQVLQMPWTTMPGTWGGVLSPITVFGITGTAVMKENQYRGLYQLIDNWTNVHKSPCFWQVKPMVVFRDGNKNFVFERDMPQQEGLFGINMHRMEGQYVNNWSIGCQGTNWVNFSKLVALARIATNLYGSRFTYTLLHREDFKPTPKETKLKASK